MTARSWLVPETRREVDCAHIHPPKVETFDIEAMTNVDPKGIERCVDEYRAEPFGLYMARPMPYHAHMSYQESWLLPEFDLRVTDFYFRPGYEQDQDFYLDIALIAADGTSWRSMDLYLDVVTRTGRGLGVLDTDELLAALAAGHLDRTTGQRALETVYRTVTGLATFGYDVTAWLADQGVPLRWRRRGTP